MRLLASVVLAALLCGYSAYGLNTISIPFKFTSVTAAQSAPVEVNVGMGGAFTVTFTTNTTNAIVQLCFQRGIAPQSDKCTFQVETTYDKKLQPIVAPALLEGAYYVTATTNDTGVVYFDAALVVTSCMKDEVLWDGTCNEAPSINTPQIFTLTGLQQVVYFTATFAVETYPASVSLKYEGEAMKDISAMASFGNPDVETTWVWSTVQNFTASGLTKSQSFPLQSTIAGTWYFRVILNTNATGNATFSLDTTSTCLKGTETGCLNQISTLATDGVISGNVGRSLSYTMYNGTDTNWRVGISTQQGSAYNSALSIYVAKGYLPFIQTTTNLVVADWTFGCTLASDMCTQMTTIELPKTNVPYYIAVSYHNATLESTPYLIWPSSGTKPCPPCNHGNCPASPSNAEFGKCKCNYGWAGINCSISVSPYRIQIIVVIIIGALLLVTAAIGLIAWFISKRKAAKTTGYERV